MKDVEIKDLLKNRMPLQIGKQTREHPIYKITKRGEDKIKKARDAMNDVYRQVKIPDPLLLAGIFSQVSPMEFERLAQDNNQVEINKLVDTAAWLALNSFAYIHCLTDKKVYQSFHNKFKNSGYNGRTRKYIQAFNDIIKPEHLADDFNCIDFEKVRAYDPFDTSIFAPKEQPEEIQEPVTLKLTPQPKRPAKPVAPTSVPTPTPQPMNFKQMFDNLTHDLTVLASTFIGVLSVSFVLGALNSQLIPIISNPFFAVVILITSVGLINLFKGFRLIHKEEF